MPPVAPIGNATPSVQPQSQVQGTVNPGLNANQISLATPPANFSQGKRFFITENNGSFQLTTVSTGDHDLAPGANPEITGDGLEVNASIAYAITTGDINPTSYMAQYTAQALRLNDAVKNVGSSPLQTPSLAGEITGDQFDASAILSFLKKNQAKLDDSNAQADISSHTKDLVSQTILANLQQALATYDSDTSQINGLNQQLQAERAKRTPDQTVITSLNTQINNLTDEANRSKATAEGIGKSLFSDAAKGGINAIKKDLDKLHKVQLDKLSKIVTSAVTKSISDQIDQALLGDEPVATPGISPIEKTADGTVIKTPETQAKEALLAQIGSEQFQADLAKSLIDNAASLGLGDLSPEDLKSVATTLAKDVSGSITSDPTIIDDAINNSDALLNDVANILTLELDGQTGRSSLPNNV
jgi:hypothetical protein